jgi:predicted permease
VPVLVFALGVSLGTGLLFSVAPAQLAARTQPAEPLRGSARSVRDGWALPQRILVISQAALSLVLLVATGLLLKSLHNLQQQQFGFETTGRLIVGIHRPLDQYKPEQLEGFYQNLQRRLESIPGVVSASFSDYSPMSGNSADEPITIPGVIHVPQPAGGLWPDVDHVSANYFATLGTRIVQGRPIDDGDIPSSRHVAVVDQAFAKLFFPNQDPIGKHFGILEAAHSGDYEIVGVAENAKYGNPHAPPYPTFFLPFLQTEHYEDTAENSEQLGQNYLSSIQLHVRGSPASYEEAVRRALAELNPNLTILYIRSFADELGLNFTRDVLLSRLTLLYGLLSLLLCAVGLYGVLSYAVVRRTNEIGIRMALGADRASVVRMVLRSALQLTAIGFMIGGPIALLQGWMLRNQLFGVSAADPGIIALALSVLAAAALIAAYIPARRASLLDPMQALRSE